MKKTYLGYSIYILMIILFVGCDAQKQVAISTTQPLPPLAPTKPYTPTPPTTTSPYTHYPSIEDPNFYLEFEYPSSWLLYEKANHFVKYIVLYDPRFATLPTPMSDDFHPTPSDFGLVSVYVTFNQPIDVEIEKYKQGSRNARWLTYLNEYQALIEGYEASVFEYQIDYPELYTSIMFERNTFFAVKDQTYQITFMIAEKDRNSEFEKGYEHFLNSLQLIP